MLAILYIPSQSKGDRMPSRFDRVLAKYEWAKEHVNYVNEAVETFLSKKPYTVRRDIDDATGEFVHKIEVAPDIPNDIRFALGDAIHNLRSTLDHAAYAVVEAGTCSPANDTHFPIFNTAQEYTRRRDTRIPGLRKMCYEAFDRIQPYKGGFGHWIWQLHRLDIIDKHRLLLTTSSVAAGRSQTPSEITADGRRKRVLGPNVRAHLLAQLVLGAPVQPVFRTVNAGDEIGRLPATEEYKEVSFAVDVALDEPGVIAGMPIFFVLGMFSANLFGVINELAPFM